MSLFESVEFADQDRVGLENPLSLQHFQERPTSGFKKKKAGTLGSGLEAS